MKRFIESADRGQSTILPELLHVLMGITLGNVNTAANRKGRPKYPEEFKRQVQKAMWEPGTSLAKLAMPHQLIVNMMFRWRRKLCEYEAEPATESPALLFIMLAVEGSAQVETDGGADARLIALEILIGDVCMGLSESPDEELPRALWTSQLRAEVRYRPVSLAPAARRHPRRGPV